MSQQEDRLFGLIGYPLSHSFSASYFNRKFENEAFPNCSYHNFEMPSISGLPTLIEELPTLVGLNVTIPHKQSVMQLMTNLDPVAEKVGAVNTIRIERKSGETILAGYNTDVMGFELSLKSFIGQLKPRAMVLGTGGASRAVRFVLEKLEIPITLISRKESNNTLSYSQLDQSIIQNHHLIINCTPLGTWPNVDAFPPIPYEGIHQQHFLFDLVYNPETTRFLALGSERGASIRNGYEMLIGQAEAAWQIWNG